MTYNCMLKYMHGSKEKTPNEKTPFVSMEQ